MLTTLNLRNFVIVEALTLDVRQGFTVLTGETGAGKSILIDALSLILGGRADTSVIREGADKTDISAEFTLTETVQQWLKDLEIDTSDETLLIRRTVDLKGRSKAWVNGVVVSISQLKDLGEMLVDVHGQHAHQSLLKPDSQLRLLDDHAGAQPLLDKVGEAYRHWKDAHKAVEAASANVEAVEAHAERLRWMIEDLESLDPKKDEWETLNNEHTCLAHGATIMEGLNEVLGGLTEGDENASSQLSSMHSRLSSLTRYDERLSSIVETLSTAIDLVEETGSDIARYLDRNDFDEESFARLDQRVTLYIDLSRKFRVEPEELYDLLVKSREELRQLTASKDVEALKRAEKAALEAYELEASALTKLREKTAKALAQAVTKEMQRLAMKGARFDISLVRNAPSPMGAEHCEYLVAGHAGVQMRPLNKVASGGELARISLAIAVITAQVTPVPTLIFDEVDSGIGGATAEVVGRLLHQLGQERQVLCVTHLPQVAACGDNHWKVEKIMADGTTISHLNVLTPEKRTWEIARMLTGIEISQNALDVAKEMLGH